MGNATMKTRKFRYFMCDFETTVYEKQAYTEVWASACVEFNTEKVFIFHSIKEQFEYFKSLNTNIIAYYHNLKFDGNFWLSFLLNDLSFKQAYQKSGETLMWLTEKDMKNNSFKYSITDRGQWYSMIIKVNNHIIELRDSLKLLPFSVKRIGESFQTKHKKLEMEYKGYRYSGCDITEEERNYIANDVLVVKEALEIMFNEGHTSLTIGSCCLKEYKHFYDEIDYKQFFPDLSKIAIDETVYGYDNADKYIRKSYKGGWCYLCEGKENKIYKNGCTFDVNSLYPSMMSSESGNYFPVGKPCFWSGNFIPEKAHDKYYFIRIKTRFYIKKGKLPFIQIKSNLLYDGTEMLKTSDIYNSESGEYCSFYIDNNGNKIQNRVELTLTMVDYKLFREHYDVYDFEILDGCYFYKSISIFDEYIEKYKKQKLENKGAKRELAKLFLNNLYGKMSSNDDSSFKVAYIKDDKTIGFNYISEHNKQVGYIAVGSAITSYARNFTIRCAQKNYHGTHKRGFIYADTDSIHCDLEPSEVVGLTIHDKNFCCWKAESQWDEAIFTRQKTYIEHIVGENMKKIDTPYYNIKCAGMPQRCKDLFEKSLIGISESELENYNDEEKEFLRTRRTLEDFKIGLEVPSKLRPKRIRGGIVLVETTYQLRE